MFFLSTALVTLLVSRAETFMQNWYGTLCEIILIWTSGGDVKYYVLVLCMSGTICAILRACIMRNILNLHQWFRRR